MTWASDTDGDRAADALVRALEGAGPALAPERFVSIHSAPGRAGDVDRALAGEFRLRAHRFELGAAGSWDAAAASLPDPQTFFLHSLVFAEPVLHDDRADEAVAPLADVFVSWLREHDLAAPGDTRWVAHDHAAASRLVYLAWVLREGVRLDVLSGTTRRLLAAGILAHAAFVVEEDNYVGTHNHGLFSDAALGLAARALRPVPEAEVWESVAAERFADVLARTVEPVDAMHLEHSPHYHWIIQSALGRFGRAGLFPALELEALSVRMRAAGAWLTAPDGTLPAIGDTAPGQRISAAAPTAEQDGMRIFAPAGYAVVRRGDSLLVVTAASHPTAHKHADDGGFCLYEDGRELIGDSGDPGHDYGGELRRYGTSPAAHSTVSVDGFDRLAAGRPPAGSGVLGCAQRGDVYAILVRVPDVTADGTAAHRLLVYRPGRWLVVADGFAGRAHGERVARRLQVALGLDATVEADGRVRIEREGETVARVADAPPPGRPRDAVTTVRGERAPMSGWTFPAVGEAAARTTVELAGPGLHTRGFVVAVGAPAPPEVSAVGRQDALSVRVADGEVTLYVRTSGGAVSLVAA